jgi:hypothetical protein
LARALRFARNAFYLVIGQVSTTALAIVFSAALGRSLGAGDFGLYFLISSFSMFAYVVVDWGQQFYVIREVARTPARGGQLLGATLALRIAGAVLISIPVGMVTWALGYDVRTCWFSFAFIIATLPFAIAQSYGFVFRAATGWGGGLGLGGQQGRGAGAGGPCARAGGGADRGGGGAGGRRRGRGDSNLSTGRGETGASGMPRSSR